MLIPPYLKKGDKVAIVSPASAVNPDYVDKACAMLVQWGYEPVVGRHCKGRYGYYSGTLDERKGDFMEALLNPEIKAILCSRGGYGAVHLAEYLSDDLIRSNPKWIIGFSDISVLHALWNRAGVTSIHASMAKHMAQHDAEERCNAALRDILRGVYPEYEVPGHEYNRAGSAQGELVGGNLAVLAGLIGTDADILKGGKILFVEDIAEPIYKVERILYSLRLSGVLASVKGIVVGRFTQYEEPNSSGETMYGMIRAMLSPYNFPVAYGFPVGHIEENLPMVEGSLVDLSVSQAKVSLSFTAKL